MGSIIIKTPCTNRWEDMVGDERARFCSDCKMTVHNFAAFTRREAQKLLRESEGRVCGRLVCNEDGKPVFRPPVPSAWERLVQISLLGIAGFSGAASAQEVCALKVDVRDASGANVHGANVIISQNGKTLSEGAANEHGEFSSQLPAGRYSITINSPGFAQFVKNDIDCSRGASVEVEAQLQVGLIGEVVEIRTIGKLPIDRPSKNLFRRIFSRKRED